MTAQTAIECRNLSKTFGFVKAIDKLNFDVRNGECFGLLGSVGSGKSTLLKMVYCNSSISSGELYVGGLNADNQTKEIKQRIGVLSETVSLDNEFSIRDNILVFAQYFGLTRQQAKARARFLLAEFNLLEFADCGIHELSLFQKKCLELARALVNEPPILVLDEPTSGLKDHDIQSLWGYLLDQKKQGRTMLLATESFDESEKLCDRLALMEKGKILCVGSPRELIEDHVGREVIEFSAQESELQYHLARISASCQYQVVKNKVRLFVKPGEDSREYLKMLNATDMRIRRATLDDVFASISGHDMIG